MDNRNERISTSEGEGVPVELLKNTPTVVFDILSILCDKCFIDGKGLPKNGNEHS